MTFTARIFFTFFKKTTWNKSQDDSELRLASLHNAWLWALYSVINKNIFMCFKNALFEGA